MKLVTIIRRDTLTERQQDDLISLIRPKILGRIHRQMDRHRWIYRQRAK
jgi:hypothetical protein